MNYKPEYFCLVLVGNWNISIFTEAWVSKYLFDGQKINVEYATNSPIASPRFSNDVLRISILGNRLQFSIMNSADTVFKLIEDLALKVSQYLEHTPVVGFGINFNFEAKTTNELENLFRSEDFAIYENLGFSLSHGTTITRKVKKDTHILNVTTTKENLVYNLDLNYHFDIASLLQFKEIFASNIIVNFKNDSLELLDKLYNLKLEQ